MEIIHSNSVDCCVTSPPYFGLRDYGNAEQLGSETTPEVYVDNLVAVFSEVRRVLKPTGTLWLNLGDSYAGSGEGGQSDAKKSANWQPEYSNKGKRYGLKPKDLIGIPWMVAFALRSAGWYLRQEIIWHKPNPMPESVTDRCTKAHEQIFLLSKSTKYYFDNEAIKTDCKNPADDARRLRQQTWNNKNTPDTLRNGIRPKESIAENGKANKRSVWTVNTKPYKEAHFATFPPALIEDCIKAGCPEGGLVLDPFMGAGTTGLVAKRLNRNYVGFELSAEYIKIAEARILKG